MQSNNTKINGIVVKPDTNCQNNAITIQEKPIFQEYAYSFFVHLQTIRFAHYRMNRQNWKNQVVLPLIEELDQKGFEVRNIRNLQNWSNRTKRGIIQGRTPQIPRPALQIIANHINPFIPEIKKAFHLEYPILSFQQQFELDEEKFIVTGTFHYNKSWIIKPIGGSEERPLTFQDLQKGTFKYLHNSSSSTG